MELYLITGFLGAGKTTFLKEFLRVLSGKRVYLIINEFGKAGVDGALLREMQATLAEINNGSIFCACRLDKFEEALVQAITERPEVILVEASGLADPTNIRKVLAMPAYSTIDYRGSVCLVDAMRFEKVVHTARVCPKQLAVSSLVLLNKTDLAAPEQIAQAAVRVRELNPTATVRQTQFGAFDKAWLADIRPVVAVEEETHGADVTLQKACLTLSPAMRIEQLESLLRLLAEDTYRIKGFAQLEGKTLLVDCVGPLVQVLPYSGVLNDAPNRIVALAGKGMPLRKALKTAEQWYGDYIVKE